jgi:predicted unusual protein kinase regulating ubiquinone biosynthesis (AarF/ABC1/UbiB family)
MYRNRILVSPDRFYVPAVIDKLSNKELLVTEFVNGIEIDTLTMES